jgi:uncharacterized membrane protein
MDFAIIVAVVAGLTQIFKQLGWEGWPHRLVPIFAIVAGIFISFLAVSGGIGEQIIQGIIAGLSAIGAYEVTKTSLIGKK